MAFGRMDSTLPKEDNSAMIKENEALKAEVAELNSKLEAEKKQNEQLTNDNKSLNEKVELLEKQIADAKTEPAA